MYKLRKQPMFSVGGIWCIQISIVLHRPMLVFWVATLFAHLHICNVQSCCERLTSAYVDRCTMMKSECTSSVWLFLDFWTCKNWSAAKCLLLCTNKVREGNNHLPYQNGRDLFSHSVCIVNFVNSENLSQFRQDSSYYFE